MRSEKYRQVCNLMENCDDHGEGEQGLGEVTVVRECDINQGVRKVLEMSVSFMGRCNGNVGGSS